MYLEKTKKGAQYTYMALWIDWARFNARPNTL